MYSKSVKIIVDGKEFIVEVPCVPSTPITEVIEKATTQLLSDIKEVNDIYNDTRDILSIAKDSHTSIETTSKYIKGN